MTQLDRRKFMAASCALAASSACSRAPVSFFEAKKAPLGVQLYTLGPELRENLDSMLARLSEIGFEIVETAGLLGRTPQDFRSSLDRAGLKATSAHIQPQGGDGTFSGDLSRLADILNAVGIKSAFMPIHYIPEHMGGPREGEDFGQFLRRTAQAMTADDWKMNADFLNEKAEALKSSGIKVGYHNHNFEFVPIGNTNGMEILLENTDPDLVDFEVDIAWVAVAGINPAEFLRKHAGRVTHLHVKDIKASTEQNYNLKLDPAEVGYGSLDWKSIIPSAWDAGVREYFIEQEAPFTMPRIDAVAMGYDYIKNLKI